MKVQVVLLLSLMCSSAFSACANYHATTATIGTDVYKIGSDTGLCCIQKNSDTAVTMNAVAGTSVCTPKGLFAVGSQVWAVIDADAVVTPLTTTAGSYTAITTVATLVTVAIGRLDLTDLSKTVAGSYIGSMTTGGVFGVLSTSGASKTCTTAPYTTILSIPVTVPAGNLLVDQTSTANTAMTSPTYIGYNTANGNFKGYSSDPCSETFTSAASVTVSSVTYQIGKKGNECCLLAGTASYYCYNDVNQPGTCTALDIATDSTSGDVWIAVRVSAAAADIMTSANGITGVDYSDSLLTSGTLIADSVLIGKVTTTTGTDFGKFIYAAYVAPKTTGGIYTTFTFTDLRACTSNSVKYAQVEGTLGTSTWVDETGTAISAATGTGAFLLVTPATSNIEGFASTGRVCAGASIVSVASAILAFVGLVAL